MNTPASVTSQLSTRLAAVGVTLLFVVNGTIIGGFGGSLPSLRDKLGLDSTQIAIMLFCAGIAAIISMQIGGRVADAVGAREVSLAAVPLLIAGMITIGLASGYSIAIVGGILLGLGNGAMDVAMNAIGVQVEAARQRPIMSFFHAFWSVGNFIGAGAVLLLATVLGLKGGEIVTPLSLSLAALTLVALGILLKITPKAAVVHHTVDGVRTRIPAVAYVLAVMALAFGLAEGTALDWSSIHVTDVAGVDPTTGALGLIVVSAFMVAIRLLGDRLVIRFGRRAVVRFGGLCAALGYLTVTLVSGLPLLLIGWALVGFGVGMIAPQVYALSGHIGGGRALAVVVTFGYAAFLIGPAFVGFLINQLGIHHAMIVPALLCAGIIGLAFTMPRNDVGLVQHEVSAARPPMP
ncbi:MAG TPA: MFS transporter [Propionibacteriaceae bacterium]|nr:MFS transporter [Propionibacteriaceae bacterium]